MVIISKKCTNHMSPVLRDPSNCGALLGLRISTESQSLLILSLYLPATHGNDILHPHSLASRLARHITTKQLNYTPTEYLLNTINTWKKKFLDSTARYNQRFTI
jgi:hypothetical protein